MYKIWKSLEVANQLMRYLLECCQVLVCLNSEKRKLVKFPGLVDRAHTRSGNEHFIPHCNDGRAHTLSYGRGDCMPSILTTILYLEISNLVPRDFPPRAILKGKALETRLCFYELRRNMKNVWVGGGTRYAIVTDWESLSSGKYIFTWDSGEYEITRFNCICDRDVNNCPVQIYIFWIFLSLKQLEHWMWRDGEVAWRSTMPSEKRRVCREKSNAQTA